MTRGLRLPFGLHGLIEASARHYLQPPNGPAVDFTRPAGEPALAPAGSVAWQVFRNPVSLFVGGVAAVILELAEPRVRAGVWTHSRFRTDPVQRLQRTGLAAMITVYGPRSLAEAMIDGVNRAHAAVSGRAEDGSAYTATDPDLLDWVQGTAAFGFLSAYHALVRPVPPAARDRFYAEGEPGARLYGAVGAPRSEAEMAALFYDMAPLLGPSPVIHDFLAIMRHAPILPRPARGLQSLLVRAAVSLVPGPLRDRLGLADRLVPSEARLLRAAAAVADRLRLDCGPAAQSCVRLGLPPDYLHRRAGW